jgi:hypothetical protein
VCARSQKEGEGQFTLRFSGCRDSLDGEGIVIKRFVRVACRILDRAANESGISRQPDRLSHDLGRIAESSLQIGGNRQIGRIHNHARVRERFISRQTAIAACD